MDPSTLAPPNTAALKEAFTLFDADGDGLISSGDIGKVMRQLGYNPTESEVSDLVRMVDTEGKGSVDFEGFCEVVERSRKVGNPEEELRAKYSALRALGDFFNEREDVSRLDPRLLNVIAGDCPALTPDKVTALGTLIGEIGNAYLTRFWAATIEKHKTAGEQLKRVGDASASDDGVKPKRSR